MTLAMSPDGGGSIKTVKVQMETLLSLVSKAQSQWTPASEGAVAAHSGTELSHGVFGGMAETNPFATVYSTATSVYGEVLNGLMLDIQKAINNLVTAQKNMTTSEEQAAAELNRVFTGVMQTDAQFQTTEAQRNATQHHGQDIRAAHEIQAEAPAAGTTGPGTNSEPAKTAGNANDAVY